MGVRLLVRSCWGSRSEDEAVYEFDQTRILIGRGRGADVRLPHRAVSVRHATIEADGTRYRIVDHGTTNGTRVQEGRIVPGRDKPLRHGDRIEVGGFSIEFLAGISVTRTVSAEHTASLARRLAREALEAPVESMTPFVTVLNGPGEGDVLRLAAPPSRFSVGRGELCQLVINDEDASREHALVDVRLDGIWIVDHESKNGVHFGERRVEERLLADRDELRIGATILRFEDPAAAALKALEDGDDESVEPPRWADLAPPIPDEPEAPATEPDEEPTIADTQPKRKAPPSSSIAPADMLIYILASVVFAVSVLGLVWLLRSG